MTGGHGAGGIEGGAVAGPLRYTVRTHPRSRGLRMRVTRRDGLVVTVPARTPRRAVERFVEANREWAEGRLAEAGARVVRVPDEIRLAATGERFGVTLRLTASPSVRAVESGGVIALSGATGDAEACAAALQRWLARAAKSRLPAELDRVAVEQGLRYGRVCVRAQRSRWASCSRAAAISLNRALLFLEPGLVRHVLLHELVHTIRPDHSPAFWRELERRDPGYAAARLELRQAWGCVPPWADC